MEEIKPGIYRHYKGKEYRVIGTAHHSETLQTMVVYQALYESEDYGKHALWVRPIGMFFEKVSKNGQEVPRFTLVEAGK